MRWVCWWLILARRAAVTSVYLNNCFGIVRLTPVATSPKDLESVKEEYYKLAWSNYLAVRSYFWMGFEITQHLYLCVNNVLFNYPTSSMDIHQFSYEQT